MTQVPTEEQLAAAAKGPRITKGFMEALKERVQIVIEQPKGKTSTFAHAYLDGSFYVASGFSACVDPANYDPQAGVQFATQDLDKKLGAELGRLAGYALYASKAQVAALPPADRVRIEYEDLTGRINRLHAFLRQGRPAFVSEAQWDLLNKQIVPMLQEQEILEERLALFHKESL